MNRIIKFRAWDPIQKEMLLQDKCYPASMITQHGLFHQNPKHIDDNYFRINRRFEIMQFTGVTDKNGKDIYEGDVCRFFWNPILNEPSELFEFDLPVEYYTGWGCFVFRLQSKKMKKKQRDLFTDYGLEEKFVAIGSPIMYGDGVEVIGNIYKNPELIKP